jgi:hypothetical protein
MFICYIAFASCLMVYPLTITDQPSVGNHPLFNLYKEKRRQIITKGSIS